MAGFPLTAWALRHPWGDDPDVVFDRLREPSSVVASEPRPEFDRLGELLDALDSDRRRACSRWGSSRVAVVLGMAQAQPTRERLAAVQSMTAERTAVGGAIYQRLGTEAPIAAMASAQRLLRASMADAVLVIGLDDERGSIILLERHGDAFVELCASAEATGTTTQTALDESAVAQVVTSVWSAVGRMPLGAVHTGDPDLDPRADTERRALRDVLGPVHCCSIPGTSRVADVVLAATSLVRGFAPGPDAPEFEHERFLVHGFSSTGQHVALLLRTRA